MFGFNNDNDENDEPREDAHEREQDELPWGYAESIDVDLDDAPGAPARSKRGGPKTSPDESLLDGGREVPDEPDRPPLETLPMNPAQTRWLFIEVGTNSRIEAQTVPLARMR
jgi:hypothetical protein